MTIALKRKFDTLYYDDAHLNEGRYSDGDIVVADPNGLGYPDMFTHETGDQADAKLGTLWDPSQTAVNQGAGTITGAPLFKRRTEK